MKLRAGGWSSPWEPPQSSGPSLTAQCKELGPWAAAGSPAAWCQGGLPRDRAIRGHAAGLEGPLLFPTFSLLVPPQRPAEALVRPHVFSLGEEVESEKLGAHGFVMHIQPREEYSVCDSDPAPAPWPSRTC